jgi:hypothetical protein
MGALRRTDSGVPVEIPEAIPPSSAGETSRHTPSCSKPRLSRPDRTFCSGWATRHESANALESLQDNCTELYRDHPFGSFCPFCPLIESVSYVFSMGRVGSNPTRASTQFSASRQSAHTVDQGQAIEPTLNLRVVFRCVIFQRPRPSYVSCLKAFLVGNFQRCG